MRLFIVLVITLAASVSQGKEFYPTKTTGKIIQKVLNDKEAKISEVLPVKENSAKEYPVSIYLIEKSGGEKKYGIITQAKGRYELFDYLVIAGMDYIVEEVKILKYRSEHGGEIASKKWLSQFIGYSTGELVYKKDISALSGATLSATSITRDIPLVMDILRSSTGN